MQCASSYSCLSRCVSLCLTEVSLSLFLSSLCQAEEARSEHIEYLGGHITRNTTHELLKRRNNEDGDNESDGDFFDSLSEAQLQRVRNQASCVRMYLMFIDDHHPEWSVDECAAAVAKHTGFAEGRTIQNWFREYANNGNRFFRDGRGLDHPDWILDQLSRVVDKETGEAETFETIFRKWLKSNLKDLSIQKAKEYLDDELFKYTEPAIFVKYKVSFPIAPSVCYSWMVRLGCERSAHNKNYYTDRHEAPDVVAYRDAYVHRDLLRELRQPVWIQLTGAEASELRSSMREHGGNLPLGHVFQRDGENYEEFHVDDSNAFLKARDTFKMGGNLSVRFPSGSKPLLRMGQDESIYKAHQFPSGGWMCEGATVLRPKTEGVGDMVSAFADCARGFGLEMSDAELAEVNAKRRGTNYWSLDSAMNINGTHEKPQLNEPPGVRFLEYGKNKEGYWNFDHMALQMEDVLDCVAVIYGPLSGAVADAQARAPPEANVDWSSGFATLQEMDWSSGHGRTKPDGLDHSKMNEKFGGAQPLMRTTVVCAEDLGPYDAKLKISTSNGKTELRDCKIKPGGQQRMAFGERDLPPHYALDTPKADVNLGYKKPKRKRRKADSGAEDDDEPEMEDAVTPGYVGKAKGLRQVCHVLTCARCISVALIANAPVAGPLGTWMAVPRQKIHNGWSEGQRYR